MNAISRSPSNYRRLKDIREARYALIRDAPMTALPRYGQKTVLTHKRGEARMDKWLPYV